MATFHPFPRLPYELRMQIWEMTVEPRVVNAGVSRYNSTWKDIGLSTCTSVPPVLQACQEARNHGLYKKCFSVLARGSGAQYIWANLEIDTIDIGKSCFESFDKVAKSIRYLMFERELQTESWFHFEGHKVGNFPNVKEVWIVPTDGLIGCIDELDYPGHWYPCGKENVFYVDPLDSERVFRGKQGEEEIYDLREKWLSENEGFKAPYESWIMPI